jgi:hypothetical protein
MHSPGVLSEFRDGADYVRRLRFPLECMGGEDIALAPALGHWKELDRGGLLPDRRSIDPLKLGQLLGTVHIVDASDRDPLNYYFRLWGSRISLDRYHNYTKLRLGDHPYPVLRDTVLEDYRTVVETGVPSYHQHSARLNFLGYSWSRLILPFADDGRRVTHLLICVNERPIDRLTDAA